MLRNRRSFIKTFGRTLGSLIVSGSLSGCRSRKGEGLSNAKSEVENQTSPSPKSRASQWKQLRQCWLELKRLDSRGREVFESAIKQNEDPFTSITRTVAREHRALLDVLVAGGELDEPVAKNMQIAFEEAAYHIVRSMATCYLGFPFEGEVRKDLLQRAEVLGSISGSLDPATVAKAQAAIAQDIAYFEMVRTGTGKGSSLANDFTVNRLQASPEALEAARLLTQLLLRTPD